MLKFENSKQIFEFVNCDQESRLFFDLCFWFPFRVKRHLIKVLISSFDHDAAVISTKSHSIQDISTSTLIIMPFNFKLPIQTKWRRRGIGWTCKVMSVGFISTTAPIFNRVYQSPGESFLVYQCIYEIPHLPCLEEVSVIMK